jgi:hypothetical protein
MLFFGKADLNSSILIRFAHMFREFEEPIGYGMVGTMPGSV